MGGKWALVVEVFGEVAKSEVAGFGLELFGRVVLEVGAEVLESFRWEDALSIANGCDEALVFLAGYQAKGDGLGEFVGCAYEFGVQVVHDR